MAPTLIDKLSTEENAGTVSASLVSGSPDQSAVRDRLQDGATDRRTLSLVLHKQDWVRLRWLAKDLGFRQFEVYAANAIRLYLTLYICQREGGHLFYGSDPLRAVRFELPFNREVPLNWKPCVDDINLTIELTEPQAELLERTCGLDPLDQFVWNALWAYHDLLSDYVTGQRIFVGTAGEPEKELDVKPAAFPRRYRESADTQQSAS